MLSHRNFLSRKSFSSSPRLAILTDTQPFCCREEPLLVSITSVSFKPSTKLIYSPGSCVAPLWAVWWQPLFVQDTILI